MDLNKAKKEMTDAYKDFKDGLQAFAFHKTHDHALGQNLLQDTFMKTWAYMVSGGEIHLMRPFLYHILENLIVDQYRKKKTLSLDLLLGQGFEPATGSTEEVIVQLDGKAAQLLIKKLPEPYRKVLSMKYIDGFSIEEMAKINGVSRNTITVQAHRGMQKLRKLYKNSKRKY